MDFEKAKGYALEVINDSTKMNEWIQAIVDLIYQRGFDDGKKEAMSEK